MYNSKRIIKYTNYYDIVFFYQNNPVLKEIVCDKLITTLKTNFWRVSQALLLKYYQMS